jgi:hypothetical protein
VNPTSATVQTVTIQPAAHHMVLLVGGSGSMAASMAGTSLNRWDYAVRTAHV